MKITQQPLSKVIQRDNAKTLFLPVISISNKSIIGYEAVYSAPSITDDTNFSSSRVNLDYIISSLKQFSTMDLKEKLLFLSLDLSSIDKGPAGLSDILLTLSTISRSAQSHNIKRENIVLEIVESNLNNIDALSEIVEVYKRQGYIIALDDFGIGYSNMDRIAILKPHIVKLDSSLIKDIASCQHKQEIFKSITGLSRRIGAVVIAKSIDSKEEAIKSLEMRADFLQGEFFTPVSIESQSYLKNKIDSVHSEFKSQILFNLELRQNRTTFLQNKVEHMKSIIAATPDLEQALYKIVYSNNFIESVYILDMSGKQISSTVISPYAKYSSNTALFSPALKDSDHSLKLYYYKIKTGESEFHITEPYISNATGNRCSTISTITENNLILCIDISESTDENNFALKAV